MTADPADTGSVPENSHDTNRRRQEIHEVLERMTGRLLPPSDRGVLGGWVPDFAALPQPASYALLKSRAETLREIILACDKLTTLLQNVESDGELLSYINEFSENEVDHGLSVKGLIRMIGIVQTTSVASQMLKDATVFELMAIESEINDIYSTGKGRRPNAHAYQVADVLAKFYLLVLKERPTYGTNDGIETGRYMKALFEIFQILGIESSTRGPGRSACQAITDDEINAARERFVGFKRYSLKRE